MRIRTVFAAAGLSLPLVADLASADSTQQAPLIHGTPSSCASGVNTGVNDGNVTTHRNADDTVTINIVIRNGRPSSTYDVAITCVNYVGTLTTNKAGNGAGNFTSSFPVPATFGVDASNQGSDYYVTGNVLVTK